MSFDVHDRITKLVHIHNSLMQLASAAGLTLDGNVSIELAGILLLGVARANGKTIAEAADVAALFAAWVDENTALEMAQIAVRHDK